MKVKLIYGAYGLHQGASVVIVHRNETFEVDDIEGERLISDGIAERVDGGVATPSVERKEVEPSENAPLSEIMAEGDFGAEYSINSSVSELRKIGKENGITFKVGTTKEEMVRALDEFFSSDAPQLGAEELVK